MVLRAVPTELRWKTSLVSPPNAPITFGVTGEVSPTPSQALAGFTGGNPNVSTGESRDKTPGTDGCAGRRRDPRSSGFAVA